MENKNDKDNREMHQHQVTKEMLMKHIASVYQLNLITLEKRDELVERLDISEMTDVNIELIVEIIEIYHKALGSKNTPEVKDSIVLVRKLLEEVSDKLYRNDGQDVLDTFENALKILNELLVRNDLFMKEIIYSIEAVRDRYKSESIFERDSISGIIAMLNQLEQSETR